MSLTNFFEDDILALLFTNTDELNVGTGGLRGSVTAGSFYISLHTADPGETATAQTANEAAYTGPYARVAVARSAAEWTVLGGNVDNDNAISFPTATSAETETHFGVGSAAAGAGNLFMIGDLIPDRGIINGMTPTFDPGALDCSLN